MKKKITNTALAAIGEELKKNYSVRRMAALLLDLAKEGKIVCDGDFVSVRVKVARTVKLYAQDAEGEEHYLFTVSADGIEF